MDAFMEGAVGDRVIGTRTREGTNGGDGHQKIL